MSRSLSRLDRPPGASSVAPAGLQLVLFGLPDSGKSALLGALGQAAQTQQQALDGTLEDLSGSLAQQARDLYTDQTHPTRQEIVAYPLRYQPAHTVKPIEATLWDCSGSVAHSMLTSADPLPLDPSPGTLPAQVVSADALLLTVAADTSDIELINTFEIFDSFLQRLEAARGERLEVAGLPVFLILTKGDKLAQPSDLRIDWMDRLEERKAQVAERFRSFLIERLGSRPGTEDAPRLAFGSIDLHIYAVAICRPRLEDQSANPREPYQVAELFREAFQHAEQFRRQQLRSQRQLGWLVGVLSTLLLGLLLLIGGMLAVNQVSAFAGLSSRVEDLRAFDRATPAERLRGTLEAIRSREKTLADIRDDKQFPQLSTTQRDWVLERYEELRDYGNYLEKLLLERPIVEQRSEEGLNAQIARLRTELAVPEEQWQATPAGQLHQIRLEEAEAVRAAVQKLRFWYEDERDRLAREMLLDRDAVRVEWAGWSSRVEKLLDPDRKPPVRSTDLLPGTANLTYQTAMLFDRVLTERAGYDSDRARLKRLLEVASALGLTPPNKERPPVLSFGRDLTLMQVRERLAQLQQSYPDYAKTFAREGLPLAALRPTIRSRYENLLIPAREEVLRQFKAGSAGREETVARWQPVRTWLKEPTELAAWRELALVLLRMEEPTAEDPVVLLAGFLNRESFDLQFDSLQLEIPQTSGHAPRAGAFLEVQMPRSGKQPAVRFRLTGEPRRDEQRRVTLYTLRADASRLRYQPGDPFWAVLPLSGGRQQLAWGESRSALYQFERLANPPRLQEENAATPQVGRRLDDVRLILRPADGLPAVPDLMPVMRLD